MDDFDSSYTALTENPSTSNETTDESLKAVNRILSLKLLEISKFMFRNDHPGANFKNKSLKYSFGLIDLI